jgi:hypothetical protein
MASDKQITAGWYGVEREKRKRKKSNRVGGMRDAM